MIDEIIHGDALDVLSTLPDNMVDSIATDPPSSIKFMGKTWDNDKGGVDGWIAWLSGVMREAMRVLKPGGHGYIWALPRTSYMTGYALHKAGFEVRDCVVHLFGTGFPKSHNLGDGIGTALKPASEHWWLCRKPLSEPTIAENVLKWGTGGLNIDKTRIGTDEIRTHNTAFLAYGGQNSRPWHQGHKSTTTHKQGRWPANVIMSHSLFCVQVGTRKISANRWGKDAPRNNKDGAGVTYNLPTSVTHGFEDKDGMEEIEAWECSDDCPIFKLGQQSGITKTHGGGNRIKGPWNSPFKQSVKHTEAKDEGTAACYFHNFSPDPEPFFYAAKPSRRERNAGCEELPKQRVARVSGIGNDTVRRCPTHDKPIPSGSTRYTCGCPQVFEERDFERINPVQNTHPTVKSQQLMRHLIRQITPTGGVVLDCFAGSGSTCVAAIAEGYHFIGIEQSDTPEEPYITIARARVQHAQNNVAS